MAQFVTTYILTKDGSVLDEKERNSAALLLHGMGRVDDDGTVAFLEGGILNEPKVLLGSLLTDYQQVPHYILLKKRKNEYIFLHPDEDALPHLTTLLQNATNTTSWELLKRDFEEGSYDL